MHLDGTAARAREGSGCWPRPVVRRARGRGDGCCDGPPLERTSHRSPPAKEVDKVWLPIVAEYSLTSARRPMEPPAAEAQAGSALILEHANRPTVQLASSAAAPRGLFAEFGGLL
jgi:hypothetical protein